jgi:hypothetical protein
VTTEPVMVEIYTRGAWKEFRLDWWEALEGPHPPSGFPNDGCTVVPQRHGRVALWPACVIHDWHYSPLCEEITFQIVADYKFMQNLYKVQRLQGVSRVRASAVALKRFAGVQKFGKFFFKRLPSLGDIR